MEVLASLMVSIVGGVICHFIVKWLEGDDNDNDN